MAVEAEATLLAVGVIVIAAFLAGLGFRRWRLPDVLLLILLGVLLGPTLGLVDVGLFQAIGPLVGTVAIIVILFDGGLEIRFSQLRHGGTGALLAVVVFAATAILCAGVAHFITGMDPRLALLLGLALGGTGAVVVIPTIQQLNVEDRSITIVSLEAAVSDVLVIVAVYGLSTAIAFGETGPAAFARGLVAVFSIGIVAGLALGFLWSRLLGSGWLRGYEYVLTLAALFLTHVGVEYVHGSGPLAVLAFGLVVGNSRRSQASIASGHLTGARKKAGAAQAAPVFGEALVGFQQETVFLIRAFFFVGLGVTMDLAVFRRPLFVATGLLLAVAVAVARIWGVALLVRRNKFPAWDRVCIGLMFPLGLAAAALSQVPAQRFGIGGTEDFAAYAAVAIVGTNALSSLFVYVISRPGMRRRLAPAARFATRAPRGSGHAPRV